MIGEDLRQQTWLRVLRGVFTINKIFEKERKWIVNELYFKSKLMASRSILIRFEFLYITALQRDSAQDRGGDRFGISSMFTPNYRALPVSFRTTSSRQPLYEEYPPETFVPLIHFVQSNVRLKLNPDSRGVWSLTSVACACVAWCA